MNQILNIVLAFVFGIGTAFIASFLNSSLHSVQNVLVGLSILYGPGFLVGLVGLFFVRGAFKNKFGPILFVIIAGVSFALGLFSALSTLGSRVGGMGDTLSMDVVYITIIIVGTLINVLQFFLFKKDSDNRTMLIGGVWLVYSLLILTLLTPFIRNMFPDGGNSFMENSQNMNSSVFILESLWQIGFYLMLAFYTSRIRNQQKENIRVN